MTYKKKMLDFIMDGNDVGKRKALRHWLSVQDKFFLGVPALLYRIPLFSQEKEKRKQIPIGQYRIYTTSVMDVLHLKVLEYLFSHVSIPESKKNESLSGVISLTDIEKSVVSPSSIMELLYELSGVSIFLHDGSKEAYSFRLIDSFRFDDKDTLSFFLSTDISLLFLVDYRVDMPKYAEKFPLDMNDTTALVLRYAVSLPHSSFENGVKLEKACLSLGLDPWPGFLHQLGGEFSAIENGERPLSSLGIHYSSLGKEFSLADEKASSPEQMNPYVSMSLIYETFRQDEPAEADTGKKMPINFETLLLSDEMRKEAREGGISSESAEKIFAEFKRIYAKLGNNYNIPESVWKNFIRKHPQYRSIILGTVAANKSKNEAAPTPKGVRILSPEDVKRVSFAMMKKKNLKKAEIEQQFIRFQAHYKATAAAFMSIGLWEMWLEKYSAAKDLNQCREDMELPPEEDLYLARLDSEGITAMLMADGVLLSDVLSGKIKIEGIHCRTVAGGPQEDVLFGWDSDAYRFKSIEQHMPKPVGLTPEAIEQNVQNTAECEETAVVILTPRENL